MKSIKFKSGKVIGSKLSGNWGNPGIEATRIMESRRVIGETSEKILDRS